MNPEGGPLSIGQKSLLLLNHLVPDSAAYNDAAAVAFTPGPDEDALGRAVTEVARRHPVLRTRFEADGADPVRLVLPPERVALEVEPAGSVLEVARRPFRLGAGVPCRVALVGDTVVLATHHIATDAQSQSIIWRDLLTSYEAELGGAPAQWPERTTGYDDFVAWEQSMLASARGDELDAMWRRECDGSVAAELPTDRPRPPVSALVGGTVSRTLAPEVVRGVHATARALGVTPFGLLTGCLQALIHRYTGLRDFTIGCPVSLRRSRRFHDVVGMLVNTVVLRANLAQDAALGEVVTEAAATVRRAVTGAAYPFALVQAAQRSRAPLFRITTTMVRRPTFEPRLAGHRLESVPVPHLEGQCDLHLAIVVDPPDGLTVSLKYDAELFDRATADRVLTHHLRVVEATCADPAQPMSRVPLVDDSELRVVLSLGHAQAEG